MNETILQQIANEKSTPCVTISMKTYRTFPDNEKDNIRLKNLIKEANTRLVNEFGKDKVAGILNKLDHIAETLDNRYNLNSLHIFVSDNVNEIVRSPRNYEGGKVHISERFAIRPLLMMMDQMAEYLILVLSKGGAKLYRAESDKIVEEVKNDDFPSTENPYYLTNKVQKSDGAKVDNMILEYFNGLDKNVIKVHRQTGLKCIVVTTADNYIKLLKVADINGLYQGHVAINYNDDSEHAIVKNAWEVVKDLQKKRRAAAISEMQYAVNQRKVLTDLGEIYRAAKQGRGDLLIAHHDFQQAVKMIDENTFDLIDDVTIPGAIDDITSDIAREVVAKKGRVVFTGQDEIKSLGNIALKTRY